MASKKQVQRLLIRLILGVCVLVFIILNVKIFKTKHHNLKLKTSNVTAGSAATKFIEAKHLYSSNSTQLFTSKEPKKTSNKSHENVYIPPPTVIHNKNINPEIIKHVQLGPDEARDEFVNRHSYNYTINSDRCNSGNIYLVMLVHSAPGNYKKRSMVRATYGSVKTYKGRRIALVFLLGAVKSEVLQRSLEEESEIFGDIVQGRFEDSYRALLRKHIMAMHWYTSQCKSDYILKLDDDTFLNPFRLIDFLSMERPGEGMWCRPAIGYPPFRDPNSKYYTPVSQYPFKKWPQFCLGFAYVTTPGAWHKLYSLSETTRIMNMDDVFVGLLALRAGVKIAGMRGMFVRCKDKGVIPDISELKQKIFFDDPLAKCGNKAFAYWNNVIDSET